MLYAIVGVLVLLLDQFLKFWTVSHIEINAFPGKELIPGVLNPEKLPSALRPGLCRSSLCSGETPRTA